MPLNFNLRECIRLECEKHKKRYYNYLYIRGNQLKSEAQRTGQKASGELRPPPHWAVHAGFNPFKVGSKKSLATYVYTLERALANQTYSPRTALTYEKPKPSGGVRIISVFQ